MEYGLQLYSVRDTTEKDLAATLQKVAELGYKYVEFAGFFGHSAEEVKAMLENNHLIVSGTHSGFGDLDQDFEAAVRYHHAIGNRNYIVPSAPYSTAAELDETIAKFNKYKPMLAAEGITLAYHNHSGEFLPNKDGQIAHDEIVRRTDIDLEIDTYWAYVGGRDPVRTLENLKDRVHVIHLKDGDRSGRGYSLGSGEAPVAAVRQKAMEQGILMVVESEGLEPDGISEVSRCMDYLKKLDQE